MKPLRAAVVAIVVVTAGGLPTALRAQVKKQPAPEPKPPARSAVDLAIEADLRARMDAQRLARQRAGLAQRDVYLRNYEEAVRPLLYVEYHRVRMLFGVTGEQRKSLAADVVRAAADTAKAAYDAKTAMVVSPGAAGNRGASRFVEDAMMRVVETRLGAGQASRYADELTRRAEESRQTSVDLIIAELDRELYLSSGQRDQMRAALLSRWNDAWFAALDGMVLTTRALFSSLSPHVVPILSDAQRSAWILRSNGIIPTSRRLVIAAPRNALPLEDDALLEARNAQKPAGPGPDDAPPARGPAQGRTAR